MREITTLNENGTATVDHRAYLEHQREQARRAIEFLKSRIADREEEIRDIEKELNA